MKKKDSSDETDKSKVTPSPIGYSEEKTIIQNRNRVSEKDLKNNEHKDINNSTQSFGLKPAKSEAKIK